MFRDFFELLSFPLILSEDFGVSFKNPKSQRVGAIHENTLEGDNNNTFFIFDTMRNTKNNRVYKISENFIWQRYSSVKMISIFFTDGAPPFFLHFHDKVGIGRG